MLTSELFDLLSDFVPNNYYFFYDAEDGKFKHTLISQKPQADREVINVAEFSRLRMRENVFTSVAIRGKRTDPNNLALSATLTDLQASTGEIFRWNGSEKIFGEGSINLTRDGDDNTDFGRHNVPYQYTFYDFILFELPLDSYGKPPIISAVGITAANSKNVNSQSSSNPKFSYGYEVLGSNNGSNYEPISEQARVLLRPLERVIIPAFEESRYRYIKLRVKPAKDGVSNDNDPGLAVNEVRIYGDDNYLVQVGIQGNDPQGKFYYPELLEKTNGVGFQVLLLDVADKLAEAEAKKLAESILLESLRDYLAYQITSITDPAVKIGQTVSVKHPVTGEMFTFLVERIEIKPTYSKIYGRDLNAEVLR